MKNDPQVGVFRPSNLRGRAPTAWFTGLSGSGKTTICEAVLDELVSRGLCAEFLDGDLIRRCLSPDLGFSKPDRDQNIQRIGFIANLLTRNGIIVLVAAISPYRSVRDEIREMVGNFIEVYVDAPLSVCESRDPKGLYKKARAGHILDFTGIDAPYEPPLNPDVHCFTDSEGLEQCVGKVLSAVFLRVGKPSGMAASTLSR